MTWMNEAEIDHAVERYQRHPVLGPATRILSEYRHIVNANSDGWPYWAPAGRAASKLMALIESARGDFGRQAETVTEAQLKKALVPLKAFCTKRKLPFPQLTPSHGVAAPRSLSPEQRIALALQVYRICLDATESFEETPRLSADLNYLTAAILDGSYCDWSEEITGGEGEPIVELLQQQLPADHVVWDYIRLSDDEPLPSRATK
jgi:hypothetical protein